MKSLQHVRTRRQLFRVTAVSAASIPFLRWAEILHLRKRHLSPAPRAGYPAY